MLVNRGPFRRKGVESYIKRMTKRRDKPIYDTTVYSILKSSGFNIPESPASIYDPDQLWKSLELFCSADVARPRADDSLDYAIRAAKKVFGRRGDKLLPCRDDEVIRRSLDTSTSAGVYFKTKDQCWDVALARREKVIKGEAAPYPCLALARTQRNNKTRLVWGYPLEMIQLESIYGRPLIEKFKDLRTPIPYALMRCDLGARLSYNLTERNIVALDFSKFDASVPKFLISTAFTILRTWFEEVDNREWDIIVKYFIHTPIVMPDGNLYYGKKKGVPSGSLFTQLVDSIVNFILIVAAMHKFELNYHSRKIFVLGDDSVFSTNKDVNLFALRTFFRKFGFNLNVKKSAVTRPEDTFHFLGFDWNMGLAEKDPLSVLLSATQPERWRERSKDRYTESCRAKDLIYSIYSLGSNLWDAYATVFPTRRLVHHLCHFSSDEIEPDETGSGFLDYQKRLLPPLRWTNVATLLMR